jgi:hypothetical protein
MKKLTFLLLFLLSCVPNIYPQRGGRNILSALSGKMRVQLYEYQGSKLHSSCEVSGGTVDWNGMSWTTNCSSTTARDGSMDVLASFKVTAGSSSSSGTGIELEFGAWNKENYLLVPAALYDGNRFRVLNKSYPPYLTDAKDRPLDMPVTITNVPHLNADGSAGEVEMLTTNCSTPMVSFWDARRHYGFILLTDEHTSIGHTAFIIDENTKHRRLLLRIAAPGIRQQRYAMCGRKESGDVCTPLKAGDEIVLRLKIHVFRALQLSDFYAKVFAVRKALSGPNSFVESMPFYAVADRILAHHDKEKWYEGTPYSYICNRPNGTSRYNHIQLAWGGVPVYSLPQVIMPTDERLRRVASSLDALTAMQTKCGLLYAFLYRGAFYSDDFNAYDKKPMSVMMRREGETLFFTLRHIDLLRKMKRDALIHDSWLTMCRRLADGIVRVWERYGQFGQFVDAETGDMLVNNSTNGAVCISALALASRMLNDSKYLEVAEAAGRYYRSNHLSKGYVGGGPGEILQCPDSESAAELAEAYTTLYDVTGLREWLTAAEFAAHLFSTWVVSYDFNFPAQSPLGRIGAHSTGSVWASVQNEHSAPGIYVLSGDFLMKLYRATGDKRYADLLKDIIHNVVQYVNTEKHQIVAHSLPGYASERVNISDWEGKDNVGGNIGEGDTNMAWETVALLSILENPGIYLRTDRAQVLVFDHLKVSVRRTTARRLTLSIANPTDYDTTTALFAEDARGCAAPLGINAQQGWPKIKVGAHSTVTVTVDRRTHQLESIK